jgi:hypothetical protein
MGGQAFVNVPSDTPIRVPRMSQDVYHKIAETTTSKLEMLFTRVTIPREAPGKLDYGDVDFLVQGIRSPDNPDIWSKVEAQLGAAIHVSNGSSHSFGIPHPDISDAYVQVDVELAPGNDTSDGAELFEWTRWMKGDSDLTQIIGICHRSIGLTCNDRGLHVRVEEIEPYNKKKALIFLTRDPDRAMQFFGFDTSKYWEGFRDEVDLFEWVSKGRFFSWKLFEDRIVKSNDRSRFNKRPMYRRFVDEYMPANPEAGKDESWSRKEVLDRALDVFDKHEQYQTMMAEHNAKEAEEALWMQIRRLLPETNSSTIVLKGLKRWVDFADGRPYITAQPLESTPMWTTVTPPKSTVDVLNWVAKNWMTVKMLEKQRAKSAKEAAKSNAGLS